MDNFKIAETHTFSKKMKKAEFKKLYKKISNYVYPMLKRNPYFGQNIKRLKGDLSDYYRYRIRDYRLFYKVEDEKVIIVIVDIK